MKKKRLVWHYQLMNIWSGGTKFVFEVAKRLHAIYDITILTNQIDDSVAGEFQKEGINVIVTQKWSNNSYLHWILFPFTILFDVVKSWKYFASVDIVLATNYPSNVVCAFYSLITKKKYFYYCYEPFGVFFNVDLFTESSFFIKVQYIF